MKKYFVICLIALMAILGATTSDAYNLEIVSGGLVQANSGDTIFFEIVFCRGGFLNSFVYRG